MDNKIYLVLVSNGCCDTFLLSRYFESKEEAEKTADLIRNMTCIDMVDGSVAPLPDAEGYRHFKLKVNIIELGK